MCDNPAMAVMPPQTLVDTPSGKIRGHRRGGIVSFRGIPFAASTAGGGRFRAPRPFPPWTGVLEAQRSGPSAPQPAPGSLMLGRPLPLVGIRTSEDCLHLDIDTPACDDARRPVLVWLYGGAFLIGSGSTFLYDGRRLAEEDAVVVTLNYRLGALGYLGWQGIETTAEVAAELEGNLGLRDQIAALEWVREHIASFGGDPGNVTIFGESAGAMSIGALLASPRGRTLFHRAILQSGAAHNVSTAEQAADRTRRFLRAAGVKEPLDAAALDALRSLPEERVLEAQRGAMAAWGSRGGPRLPFQPTLDGDLLPKAPLDAIREADLSGHDVLWGTTLHEWKLFKALSPRLRRFPAGRLERKAAVLLERLGGDPGLAEEMVALYRDQRRGRAASDFEVWVALRTDEIFRIPANVLGEALETAGARQYAYLFDFPAPAFPRVAGACHSIDLPFTFGTLRHPLMLPIFLGSREAERLSQAVRRAWVSFARGGVPVIGRGIAWPTWGTAQRATLRLDRTLRVDDAPMDEERRFWEAVLGNGAGELEMS